MTSSKKRSRRKKLKLKRTGETMSFQRMKSWSSQLSQRSQNISHSRLIIQRTLSIILNQLVEFTSSLLNLVHQVDGEDFMITNIKSREATFNFGGNFLKSTIKSSKNLKSSQRMMETMQMMMPVTPNTGVNHLRIMKTRKILKMHQIRRLRRNRKKGRRRATKRVRKQKQTKRTKRRTLRRIRDGLTEEKTM